MPCAFVTGGTGFLGLNLVELLREQNWHVIATHRPTSVTKRLETLGAELRLADLGDPASLVAAMPEAVDAVFHVAADVGWWKLERERQERVNVEGTRNLVEAALRRRAKRFVLTSSGAAFGFGHPVIDERTPSTASMSPYGYVRTKWLAEQEVRKGIANGLAAVLLNPAHILGPYAAQSWGGMLVLLKQGKLPAVGPGTASFCHAREVARAHVHAVTRGIVGDNYLLGGANATYAELGAIMAELVGVRPPQVANAFALRAIGQCSEWMSYLTRKEPGMSPGIAKLLCSDFRVDDSKARRELGYREVSLRQMTEDTFSWLKSEGLV
jgi:nucleoside-diphosphate-sugar epimerase